ncbi:MAG TPA: RNA 2',3'-cyclic phosphodiesterase [Gemmatimonadales bacterium]|nr:RNA 2',3'-cyclic phosphodiesterase [Gemmatimonadales bacterium]
MRQGLWDAIGPVRERGFPVKWVLPEAVHLTLKFLGDADDAREPELRAALTEAAGRGEPRGVTIHVEGFGVFPDFKRPRVVWAGVAPDPALELLQHRVEQVFAPLGFPTEAKAFRPHLTLGRAKRDARPRDFSGLEGALGAIAFSETVLVPDVDLMESTLQSGGAVYQVKHRGRLS